MYYHICERSILLSFHFTNQLIISILDSVCHLYYDLEFKLALNTTVEPLNLLETFIQVDTRYNGLKSHDDHMIFPTMCSTYAVSSNLCTIHHVIELAYLTWTHQMMKNFLVI